MLSSSTPYQPTACLHHLTGSIHLLPAPPPRPNSPTAQDARSRASSAAAGSATTPSSSTVSSQTSPAPRGGGGGGASSRGAGSSLARASSHGRQVLVEELHAAAAQLNEEINDKSLIIHEVLGRGAYGEGGWGWRGASTVGGF